ncbi:MAG: methylated-DNA--[protein]-cysteine S-methyltransferase [Mycobacteriales bacterium]
MSTTYTTSVDSPVGTITLCGHDTPAGFAITRLSFGDHEHGPRDRDGWVRDDARFRAAAEQLGEFFRGERQDFDLLLDPAGTPFQHQVWQALRRIPYGETRSYADIANMLGSPTATRAVGAANGRNPIGIVVPCHRVIGADGSLTGYAGGVPNKRWLLDHERRVTGAALF